MYDLEQGIQNQVFDELMPAAVDGSLPLDELLTDYWPTVQLDNWALLFTLSVCGSTPSLTEMGARQGLSLI